MPDRKIQMKKHKTGIFSGSFNPIHIGHLALANYLCEYEGLDEIWFMVSPQNPLKTQSELWSDGLRLKLVELSIKVIRIFKLRISSFTCHVPLTACIHWKSYALLIPNGTSISLSALTTGRVSTVGISRSVS